MGFVTFSSRSAAEAAKQDLQVSYVPVQLQILLIIKDYIFPFFSMQIIPVVHVMVQDHIVNEILVHF